MRLQRLWSLTKCHQCMLLQAQATLLKRVSTQAGVDGSQAPARTTAYKTKGIGDCCRLEL